ncbi:unnamed protein product [Meloidogyne enterolobii]|uniref:Uncharacterized protein n=1 Tax=Meloidogyne enterolobii TaxID=390850 RepID=A0ACB0XK65_MELEN
MSHVGFLRLVLQNLARWVDAFDGSASNRFLLRRRKRIDAFLDVEEFDCRPISLMLILVD